MGTHFILFLANFFALWWQEKKFLKNCLNNSVIFFFLKKITKVKKKNIGKIMVVYF
jgi:hypothetical protein